MKNTQGNHLDFITFGGIVLICGLPRKDKLRDKKNHQVRIRRTHRAFLTNLEVSMNIQWPVRSTKSYPWRRDVKKRFADFCHWLYCKSHLNIKFTDYGNWKYLTCLDFFRQLDRTSLRFPSQNGKNGTIIVSPWLSVRLRLSSDTITAKFAWGVSSLRDQNTKSWDKCYFFFLKATACFIITVFVELEVWFFHCSRTSQLSIWY